VEKVNCVIETGITDKPWWRLQLPAVYRVLEIEVTNRNSDKDRLNGLEILIGNSKVNNGNDNPRVGTSSTIHQHSGDGEEHHTDTLLYCRDFHWDLLSIRGPEEQEIIDEMVSSAPFSLTSHLWVGLRRSIFGTSWFWMSGDPMDFTQWEHGSHQSSPCGSMASMEPSTWKQRSCEEHLNFICYTGWCQT
ncbi:hypothetical protein NHX12_014115, partial [Muraenolepis orangiensis]